MAPSAATALVGALTSPDASLPERAIRSTVFDAPSGERILSWKVAEHLYRSHTAVLPTMARGLFTTEDGNGEHRVVGRGYDKFFNVDEVAYTSWDALERNTTGPFSLTLKSNGCLILLAPLSSSTLLVTSKHALDTPSDRDGEDGYRGGHARVGREWVQRHLAKVGRTEDALAKELWDKQVSAVAELCDDSFEEHVLPYPPHLTGLHLHGLVSLSPAFFSLPPAEVAQFARDWGFIETRFVELPTVKEVREYVERIEANGEWDGERVEGFVVRAVVSPPSSAPTDKDASTRPPYLPGSPFFWKVKFAQPYLLYRSLREITKSLLPILDAPGRAWSGTPWTGAEAGAGGKKAFVMTDEMRAEAEARKRERQELKERKARGEVVEDSGKSSAKKAKADKKASQSAPPAGTDGGSSSTAPPASINRDPVKVPPSQFRYPECTPYSYFVRKTMLSHPEWYKDYAHNKGIIKVREEFLAWLETDEGRKMLEEERAKPRWRRGEKDAGATKGEGQDGGEKTWGKTLIVPVAIPGCGKTAIGLALHEFFGFAHIQSDDVKTKKTAPEFNKNVGLALKKHDVVFADRNNHLAQHREELEKTAASASAGANALPTRLIALNFALTPPTQPLPQHTLHRICSSRIAQRGERHQTLRAMEGNVRRHEDILWRFFVTADPLARDEVDEVIQLRVEASLEDNLRTVLARLAELMPGLKMPSDERVQAVLGQIRKYDPDVKKPLMEAATRADRTRYYALAPEVDLPSLVRDVVARSVADEETKGAALAFLAKLQEAKRVTPRPHITLVHEAEVETERLAALSIEEREAEAASGGQPSSSSHPPGPWKRTWDKCVQLANAPVNGTNDAAVAGGPPLFDFAISHLVFSDKVMSLVVSSLTPSSSTSSAAADLSDVPDIVHAHFTVGTASDAIKPFEGRLLVIAKRKSGMQDGEGSGVLRLEKEIKGQGRVVGLG